MNSPKSECARGKHSHEKSKHEENGIYKKGEEKEKKLSDNATERDVRKALPMNKICFGASPSKTIF